MSEQLYQVATVVWSYVVCYSTEPSTYKVLGLAVGLGAVIYGIATTKSNQIPRS